MPYKCMMSIFQKSLMIFNLINTKVKIVIYISAQFLEDKL